MFFKVTLPLLKPALMVAIIFRALDALRIFDLIYVMTGNNQSTMSMSVYARQQLVDFQDVGYGSAASTMLFLIIAVFTVVYLMLGRIGRRIEHGAVTPGSPARGAIERRRLERIAGRDRASISCWSSSSSIRSFPFYWAIVSSLKRARDLFTVDFSRSIRPGTTTSRCSASSRSGGTS